MYLINRMIQLSKICIKNLCGFMLIKYKYVDKFPKGKLLASPNVSNQWLIANTKVGNDEFALPKNKKWKASTST